MPSSVPGSAPGPSDLADPNFRRRRAAIAAYAMHARYDARDTTAAARAKFLDGWQERVDPRHELADEVRHQLGQKALRAHMRSLALRSAQARAQARRRRG